jgi:FKBP-type peptidyl-prolyl cis-trans isomerase
MRIKTSHILCAVLALTTACTTESIKNTLLQQEKAIESYITALKKEHLVDTVYNLGGVYRAVLEAGAGEGAAPGDSVIFDYEAYIFSSGKGALYDFGSESGTLGSGSYFSGLETGLTGMLTGEHAEIIMASDKAYGNVPVGLLPPNTPLIFEIQKTV